MFMPYKTDTYSGSGKQAEASAASFLIVNQCTTGRYEKYIT
jgi:hypothetical protein